MRCRDGTGGRCKFNNKQQKQLNRILTEKDFYPPQDNRHWRSGVENIYGGDNFARFFKDYYRLFEEEGW